MSLYEQFQGPSKDDIDNAPTLSFKYWGFVGLLPPPNFFGRKKAR